HGTAMFRVSADPRWAKAPAATSFAARATTPASGMAGNYIAPGSAFPVDADLINHGRLPVVLAEQHISAPDGWSVVASGPTARLILRTEESLAGHWTVTPPADAAPGPHELTVTSSYREGRDVKESSMVVRLIVPDVAP